MRRSLLLVVVIAACSGKSSSVTTAGSGSAGGSAGSASAGVASIAAAATAKVKPRPAPTKAQIAEFRKHMKAGWAAQKQHAWADATSEFEAASKILDGEQRALAELGWSAMNAGDYVKARKADEQAVGIAIDPKVKASALYNLGMVQEKAGDKDGALRSFRVSLDLRPNKIVEAELAKLGGSAPDTDQPICTAGMKPCDCVVAAGEQSVFSEEGAGCAPNTEIKPPVAGWHVYRLGDDNGYQDWLLDEKDQVVTQVGEYIDRMRSSSKMSITKSEVKTVAGHQVLWLETTSKGTSDYMDDETFDQGTNDAVYVTICTIGDAKTATHCEADLPGSWHNTDDHDRIDEGGEIIGKGKHTEADAQTEITIADDGTINVKLVKGAADWMQSQLGPHKLWK